MEYLSFDQRRIALDADGHLQDPADWSPELARWWAAQDGLEFSEAHWWLIEFVRDHHRKYDMPPLMRVVIAQLRNQAGFEKAGSRELYRLFPGGPVRLACRYAGLKAPESCI